MFITTETGFLGVSSKQTRLGRFAGEWGRESWGDGVELKFSSCVFLKSLTALFLRHMLN